MHALLSAIIRLAVLWLSMCESHSDRLISNACVARELLFFDAIIRIKWIAQKPTYACLVIIDDLVGLSCIISWESYTVINELTQKVPFVITFTQHSLIVNCAKSQRG